MVHLVLFWAEEHLEAGFAGNGRALRELDTLGEKSLRETFEGPREFLAFGVQKLQDLALGSGYLLFSGRLRHVAEEIEALQRAAMLDDVHLLLEARAHRDMHQRFGDGTGLGGDAARRKRPRGRVGSLLCM